MPQRSLVGSLLGTVALMLAALVVPPILQAQDVGQGRAVLVTGASSGIGLRMTEVLARNGFHVYAGARSAEDLARLDGMDNVQSVRLDVNVLEEIDAAVMFVEEQGRGLHGLINNAGVAVIGPLIEMTEEDMAFQMDVNVFGPYRVTKAFAPLLTVSQGRVMTTGSISGILSGPFLGAYSMSKHAVEAFTDALAAEMTRFGVEVSVVEPGNYNSQIGATLVERMQASGYDPEDSMFPEEMRRYMDRMTQYGEDPEPYDVAEAALDFLTSETPKRRYMVVPTQRQAEVTIRKAIQEAVELNQDHRFSFTRDELVAMVDEALAGLEGGNE
ncbi:MAG: SDR family oxidoreductase [Gemmatimonadota bacterium]|nr:SDR family oxidoreductase [Gemmatimonadota bacterium]